jgi:hypothetical protein
MGSLRNALLDYPLNCFTFRSAGSITLPAKFEHRSKERPDQAVLGHGFAYGPCGGMTNPKELANHLVEPSICMSGFWVFG